MRHTRLSLMLVFLTACGSEKDGHDTNKRGSNEDQQAETEEALELGITTNNLFPTGIVMKNGTVSTQPLSVLRVSDQSGEQDNYAAYKDFTPSATGLQAQITFNVPTTINRNATSMNLETNYRGWEAKRQVWRFHIYDITQKQWVALGTNAAAGSWVWSRLSFTVPNGLSRYVDANNNVLLRYGTTQNIENSNLDYLALVVTSSSDTQTKPVPNPTPTSTPPAPTPSPIPNPNGSSGTGRIPPGKIYGVTIDSIGKLPATLTSLSRLAKRPTTRIVFDEFVPATTYLDAASQIYNVSYVMGEILDSYYVKSYSVDDYAKRVTEYLNVLGSKVDIWEVGNEINGEWLGNTADVVAKMTKAYDLVKQRGGVTELTLYYNQDCWANPANEMFTWTNKNVPDRMKQGLDYVLISYYEDDCNGLRPDWQAVFNRLGQMFPNSRIGFGEVGTTVASKKVDYMNRYYGLTINHPRYVGGYFWWYFMQDMVPYTGPYWTALNQVIMNH